jgi:HAD superfamily hydrolase (TIGR01509 family)
VFDLDGTLVDNMRFHVEAWVAIAARLGRGDLPPERFSRDWAGRKNAELFALVLGRPVGGEELARLEEEKEGHYRALYAPHLAPLPGALALLERLHRAGVPVAIATSAPPPNRAFVLDGLGLRGRVAHVVGAEDAARGKPHPDLFLAAARALGLPPDTCLAFEDAVSGVQAAVAAGMETVGVTTTQPPGLLREAGARWTVPDFTSLPPELEQRLLSR